jgi:uncharacterized RDD family membrane protein YckC
MSQEDGQLVRSPEQVTLFLPVAGPTTRILAYAIDWMFIVVLMVVVSVAVVFGLPAVFRGVARLVSSWFETDLSERSVSRLVYLLLALAWMFIFVIELGYFVFFEWVTGGQSLGKRWLRIRVVQDGGFPIELRQSIVRNLLRAVDSLPGSYIVGLAAVLLSEHGKRLGDLAAGTVVVRLDRPPRPAPLPEAPAEERSRFTFDREQLARIGPTEVALAMETLRRIPSLDPERAAEALARASGALAVRIGCAAVDASEQAAFLRAILDAVGV